MAHILSGILSLIQYKNEVEGSSNEKYRPERCECCGRLRPRRHGAQYNELTHAVEFDGFWGRCLECMSFSNAMRLCQIAGVSVP
jgi:hypothetical protein